MSWSYDPVAAIWTLSSGAHFDEVHVVVAVNAAKTPMFSKTL